MNKEFLKQFVLSFIPGLILLTLFGFGTILMVSILNSHTGLHTESKFFISIVTAMVFIGFVSVYFIKNNFWKTTAIYCVLYSIYGFFVAFPIFMLDSGENSIYELGVFFVAGFIPAFFVGAGLMKLLRNKSPKVAQALVIAISLLFLFAFAANLMDLEIMNPEIGPQINRGILL